MKRLVSQTFILSLIISLAACSVQEAELENVGDPLQELSDLLQEEGYVNVQVENRIVIHISEIQQPNELAGVLDGFFSSEYPDQVFDRAYTEEVLLSRIEGGKLASAKTQCQTHITTDTVEGDCGWVLCWDDQDPEAYFIGVSCSDGQSQQEGNIEPEG